MKTRVATSWIFFAAVAAGFLVLRPLPPPSQEGYTVFRKEAKEMMHQLDYRLRTCENQGIILAFVVDQLVRMPRAPLAPRDMVQRLRLKVADTSPHDPSQQPELERAVESYLAVLLEGVAHAVAGSAGKASPGAVADQLRSLAKECELES